MTRTRTLVRTSALLAIFVAWTAGAEGEHNVAVDGCGYSCDYFDDDACFPWPSEQMCSEHIEEVCEIALESWGPDCVRACQVADAMCGTEECVNPEHVHYYCTFEIRDPH
jgi:hypothetical protein